MQNTGKRIMCKVVRGASLILMLSLLVGCGNNTKNAGELSSIEIESMESESIESITPEEEIEEVEEVVEVVENTEEKPKRKVINVHDAQKFLESQEKTNVVNTFTKSDNNEAITPIPETPVPATSTPEPEVAKEVTPIVTNQPIETTVNTVDVDFSSSSNLQAIKASADAQIHSECGGGNEYTGFILTPDTAYISYFGSIADNICTIRKNNDTVTLTINAELNDLAWNCMSAAMSEIFPNGATLISACRKDCENGTGGYGAENQWVIIDGVATTVDVLAPEDAGAANLGSIIYTFKR